MIHLIVFSKDRPAQLQLLLESIQRHEVNHLFSMITVLYLASDSDYEVGYREVYHNFENNPLRVYLIPQMHFTEDLLRLTDTYPASKFTCFMTDDDVLYRDINITYQKLEDMFDTNPELLTFSLRLGSNTYIQDQYTQSHVSFPKEFTVADNTITWNWTLVPRWTNFAYPLSVDGHIFRTNEIGQIIQNTHDITNPNSLEGNWQPQAYKYGLFMSCFNKSVLVNNPVNRVQEVCCNQAGNYYGISSKEMNEKFLDGYVIDYDAMDFSNIIGCHQEIEVKWKKN